MLVRLEFSDGNTLTRMVSKHTLDMILARPYSETWLHFNGEKIAVLENVEVLGNVDELENEVQEND